jgi:hypothetical protein
LRLGTGGRAGLGLLLTLVAAVVLARGVITLGNPKFTQPLEILLVCFGVFIIAINAYGMKQVLDRTPVPKGVPFLEGLRASMIAYGGRTAWTARHPWLMTAITLAAWLFVSVGAAARFAFYSR